MNIIRCTTEQETAKKATQKFQELLWAHAHNPLLLLFAGGSSLKIVEQLRADMLGNNVTLTVSDDRFDTNPAVNNFALAMNTPFFQKAKEQKSLFIDTKPREGETVTEGGKRFDQALKTWKAQNPDGNVLMTQGVGPDGHTQGIMPYSKDPEVFQKLFMQESMWAVGYNAQERNEFPLRVTVTIPFLTDVVNHSIVFITGENKRDALTRMKAPDGTLWETPARVVQNMKDVTLFTDIS